MQTNISAKYFLFWLKGYLAALKVTGEPISAGHVAIINDALEKAIQASHD